ncbi:hypothetical protein AKO1_008192 [Acrasis kona]|uniref:RNA-polymerase II-associated protein 3-like C-terminal domain-containing protein n=1 Tax=Acrasis kona TaxID=1008807 RepID=A0AAW2YKD4_9EUKA
MDQPEKATAPAPKTKKEQPKQKSIPKDQTALELKDKGNEAFKKKDFQTAINYYTQSLKIKEDAVVYCNRATTNYKLNKLQEAEMDATKCVALDHTYAKGYVRRGIVRRDLKNYEGSVSDIEKALVFSNNKEFEKELEKSREALEKANKATSKRMVIEELDEIEEEVKKEEPKVEVKKEEKIEQEEEIEDLLTPAAAMLVKSNTDQQKQNTSHSSQQQKSQPAPKQAPQPTPQPEEVKPQTTETRPAQQKEKLEVPKIPSKVPTQPPRTSYEFERVIKDLDNDGVNEYVKIIPPATFKKIFKDSLSEEVLVRIVNCIDSYLIPNSEHERSVDILRNLAQSPRLDVVVSMLDDEPLDVLKNVFDSLVKAQPDNKDLGALKKKFV